MLKLTIASLLIAVSLVGCKGGDDSSASDAAPTSTGKAGAPANAKTEGPAQASTE